MLSGANADWLHKRVRSGPFTLRKLTTELAVRGITTDVRAVWTFVHAGAAQGWENPRTKWRRIGIGKVLIAMALGFGWPALAAAEQVRLTSKGRVDQS